jgi:hypothetical protein
LYRWQVLRLASQAAISRPIFNRILENATEGRAVFCLAIVDDQTRGIRRDALFSARRLRECQQTKETNDHWNHRTDFSPSHFFPLSSRLWIHGHGCFRQTRQDAQSRTGRNGFVQLRTRLSPYRRGDARVMPVGYIFEKGEASKILSI